MVDKFEQVCDIAYYIKYCDGKRSKINPQSLKIIFQSSLHITLKAQLLKFDKILDEFFVRVV